MTEMRTFETGATRDLDVTKNDYEGFLSPLVIEAFGEYMTFNRNTAAGVRDSDNWQKGIPLDAYIKSGWRHFLDWWKFHRGHPINEGVVWALCGLLFNVQGYLHELLKKDPALLQAAVENAYRRKTNKALGDLLLPEPVLPNQPIKVHAVGDK